MIKIVYDIIDFGVADIELITPEEVHYNLLLGNVAFISSSSKKIEMRWGWIPLLDFAYSLNNIVKSLKNKEISENTFDFTESDENLNIFKSKEIITITASFTDTIIETNFIFFEKAVLEFHTSISNYIILKTGTKIPTTINKYLAK